MYFKEKIFVEHCSEWLFDFLEFFFEGRGGPNLFEDLLLLVWRDVETELF